MFANGPFSARAFATLPDRPAARLLAAAFIGVNFQFVIYAASSEYVTGPNDAPPSQPFYGTVSQPLSFKRSLLGGSTIGQFTTGQGEIDLVNTDGAYDYLIKQYAVDGRDITVKIGRQGDTFDKFYTIFKGPAADWSIEEDQLRLIIEDNSLKLAVPLQPNLYGGTGDIDGGADLVGKIKPRCFGVALNVSPPLVIPASLVYQINDGPVQGISAVYDRGVALTQDADYATSDLLVAATIPPGAYATCLAFGFFRLDSKPTGTVTADVQGDKTGGTYVTSSADIVRRIVSTTTVLVDPDDIYLPAFIAVNLAQPAIVGFWSGADDSYMVSDVLANLMGGAGGWAGFRRDGKFEVGIFTAPAGPPVSTFGKIDAIDIKRGMLPSGLTPPPWRWRLGYARNWTVQTDLAGAVSSDRVSFAAAQYRLAEASDTTIKVDHPFAQDVTPINSYFAEQADALAEASRLLALYRTVRALYTIELGVTPFHVNLGETISVQFPRWDLSFGRLMRVVEMTEDASKNNVEIVGYG